MDKESYKRLVAIREEMMDLLHEAKEIMRREADAHTYQAAKSYWIGQIDVALGGGAFVDTYDTTMQKHLKQLNPGDKNEEDDEEYEETEDEDL